jgi:purine-nucleoside phosphorylase
MESVKMNYIERVKKATEFIKSKISFEPEIGIILGTGLGSLADHIENPTVIEYKDIPEFPVSTVVGHAGRLLVGTIEGKKVIAMQGRFHYYEGYPMQDVTLPVRVMKILGVKLMIVSNACGGLNPAFSAGDIMAITDHINMMGSNPLIGPNLDEFGPRFPDMSEVYNKEYIKLLEAIAQKSSIKLQKGVYSAVSGPNYFSKAELRMLITIGADTIGMSTVPECMVARHSGMKVLGVSCITDMAIPDTMTSPTHEEIVKVAEGVKPRFVSLLKQFIKEVQL